jgi:rod shape-determining protein MreC
MRRRLRHDPFSSRIRPALGAGRISLVGVVLLALSVALLLLSRIDHALVRQTRAVLSEWTTPLVSWASLPLAPVRRLVREFVHRGALGDENARLVAENARLKSWEWRARELEQRLAALAPIARVVPEQPMPFLTARVLADSVGPFVRAALIAAGADQGLRKGQPVIDAGGLVGRLVEVGARTSQVLLVTDLQSRIPVEIGDARRRAIMIGDNTTAPRIEYLERGATITRGDAVATSGAGGGLPRGLRVGEVIEAPDGPRVSLTAGAETLDYVSVLVVETTIVDAAEHRVLSGVAGSEPHQPARRARPGGRGE